MSDYPFKKGDLVEIKSSITYLRYPNQQGVIVTVKDGGFFDVLVEGEMKLVHRNYLVTPKVKQVNLKGGLK